MLKRTESFKVVTLQSLEKLKAGICGCDQLAGPIRHHWKQRSPQLLLLLYSKQVSC